MSNPNLIINPTQAREMADAENPYRELAAHARALGLVAVSADMIKKADEASAAAVVETDGFETTRAESHNEYDKERLLDILRVSGIAVSVWLKHDQASQVVEAYGGGNSGSSFKALHSSNMSSGQVSELLGFKTSESVLKRLNKDRVPEIVTFTSLENSKYYSAIPGRSGKGSVTIMTYETAVGGDYRQGTDGAPASSYYHLLMEPEQARSLQLAIEADPLILHMITDTMMKDFFGLSDEAWHERGPRYDAWRELNGGVDRIAMRQGLDEPIEKAKVVLGK